MYESVILGQQPQMASYFNVELPGALEPVPEEVEFAERAEHDISIKKFFDLVNEVSNGDAPLLKYKDNECIQNCIKIKWVEEKKLVLNWQTTSSYNNYSIESISIDYYS